MDSPEEPIGQVMYTSCRTKKPLTRPSSGNQYLSIEKGEQIIICPDKKDLQGKVTFEDIEDSDDSEESFSGLSSRRGRNKMDSPEEPIGQVMYTSCRTKKPLTRPSSGNQYLSIEKGEQIIICPDKKDLPGKVTFEDIEDSDDSEESFSKLTFEDTGDSESSEESINDFIAGLSSRRYISRRSKKVFKDELDLVPPKDVDLVPPKDVESDDEFLTNLRRIVFLRLSSRDPHPITNNAEDIVNYGEVQPAIWVPPPPPDPYNPQ